MAKLYYTKIKNGEINPATNRAWDITDVPALWHDEVQLLLDQEENHDQV